MQVLHAHAQRLAAEATVPGSIDASFVATDSTSHEFTVFVSSGIAFPRRTDLLRQAHGWRAYQPAAPPPEVPLTDNEVALAQIESWSSRDKGTLVVWLTELKIPEVDAFFRTVLISM